MKISYNWLKDYIDINIETEELSQILTDIGLEVEGEELWEEVKGGLKKFYVGEVLTCVQHPNADKLSLTTVDVGAGEALSIVCGAPNVAAGQKVIVSTIGAELFSDDGSSFTIKKTKLRGELSEGMICAEDEIGLGKSHDGIMVLDASAKVGMPAAEFLKLKTDTIFEIGLTPNRIDAASHYGVARDLAAYFAQTNKVALTKPAVDSFIEGNDEKAVEVVLEDTDACKRYAGLTISGIKVQESPEWMQLNLKAIGLNPINNVVDATNYVLHELGQPLHAFDADKLKGNKIVVKKLAEGTKFVALDEEERKLSADDLMVCDAEKGACIAGVFGGLHSGVSEATTNIFLESAYFDAVSVRKTAKRHMLSTDSSFRFERGVDPENIVYALKRAALLITDLAGGKVSSKITDIYPVAIEALQFEVKFSHIDRLIGKSLDRDLIKNILTNLDIKILSEEDDVLNIEVAPYRVDVTREADVIEEILRIYGYNNVEFSKKLNATLSPSIKPDNEVLVNQVSDFLASNGYNEIMSNSLTKSSYYTDLKTYQEAYCVRMLNPLSSDLGVMRQTLLFNGLEAIAYNINRQNANLRLFEYGRCYKLNGKDNPDKVLAKYSEDRRIGIYLTGNKSEASWNIADEKANLFQLKAYCETILKKVGVNLNSCKIESLEGKEDIFSGGVSYSINKKLLFEIGMVSPAITHIFDIDQEVVYAEIRWDEIMKFAGKAIQFKEMSKFPEVRRDLALLVNEEVSFNEIDILARQSEKKLLKRVNLFDFFKGKGVPEGKKSYGVSFYLQDEGKTLTDKEIDRIMNKLTQSLTRELEAELR